MPNVITNNAKAKATLAMPGFTDFEIYCAVNFGEPLSHNVVNLLLQSRPGAKIVTETKATRKTNRAAL